MAMNEGDQTNVDADTIYTLHLFAGAGGGILGDLLLGHIPVGAVEIEAYPRKVLLARQLDGSLPGFPIWDDVCSFRADNPDTASYIERLRGIRDRLCICGGFPCQDISCAGKGAGIEGARSGLWREFARIIGEIRPRYAFVENSPTLAVRGLGRVLGDLAEMGYNCRHGVLGGFTAGGCADGKRMWILAKATDGFGREHTTFNEIVVDDPKESSRREFDRAIGASLSEDAHSAHLRDTYGLARAVDRMRAAGNGQRPRLAAIAWKALMGV